MCKYVEERMDMRRVISVYTCVIILSKASASDGEDLNLKDLLERINALENQGKCLGDNITYMTCLKTACSVIRQSVTS